MAKKFIMIDLGGPRKGASKSTDQKDIWWVGRGAWGWSNKYFHWKEEDKNEMIPHDNPVVHVLIVPFHVSGRGYKIGPVCLSVIQRSHGWTVWPTDPKFGGLVDLDK